MKSIWNVQVYKLTYTLQINVRKIAETLDICSILNETFNPKEKNTSIRSVIKTWFYKLVKDSFGEERKS